MKQFQLCRKQAEKTKLLFIFLLELRVWVGGMKGGGRGEEEKRGRWGGKGELGRWEGGEEGDATNGNMQGYIYFV